MALSVILLLSIALMKTFENRTIETVHLENTLQQFQTETLSRSVFRAILTAIKTKGLVFVKKNQNSWKGVPLPLTDQQYFQINEIVPVDHLFNLNRRFREADPWPTVLTNIINKTRAKKDPLAIELIVDEIYPLLSALNDWIDADLNQDEDFLYSYEEYSDVQPEFLVKNRSFDTLSEIKNIPLFREFGLSMEDMKNEFRVFPGDEKIDLNLVAVDEVESFLDQFIDVEQYPNVYEFRTEIADLITKRDEELGQENEEGGFADPDPRFEPPISGRNSTFKSMLTAEGINLNTVELALFEAITNHLLIKFSVTSVNVTVDTEALVKITYTKTNSLDIKSFEILSYKII